MRLLLPIRAKLDGERVQALLRQFAGTDQAREKAHQQLLRIGKSAVQPLVGELKNPNRWVRWEAVRALQQVADPSTANALADSLEDIDFDVRWVAAQTLAALQHDGLIALLRNLSDRTTARGSERRLTTYFATNLIKNC